MTTKVGDVSSLPPGWSWAPLAEVARLESGHTPSRSHPEYWGGDIPWLSLKDIRRLEGNYVHDTVDMPTQLGIDHSSARVLPKGTVALCRTASVGKAVILGRAMATSQDFVNWVCGPRLHPEYLLAALRASADTFGKEKQGSTHQTIYMPTLKRFMVLLPPLPEQRRIAAILDKADAIRRKRQQAIQLSEELLRSVFLDMFGDPVTNPKGWTIAQLGELGAIQGGLQVTTARNSLPIEVPYLRVANVFRDSLDLSTIKTIQVTPAELERASLARGDILIVEGHGNLGEIGRAATWDGSICPCVHQNHLIRVRVDRRLAEPRFVSAFLNSAGGRSQLAAFGKTTSGLNTISANTVRRLKVMIPPVSLQGRWAEAAERCQRISGLQSVASQSTEWMMRSAFATSIGGGADAGRS